MLDKIPTLSFKDFLTYFIPGVVFCTFSYDIVFLSKKISFLPALDIISEKPFLLIVWSVVSFVIGFFISQMQILYFRKITNKSYGSVTVIENIIKIRDIITQVNTKLIERYKLTSIDRTSKINQKEYFELCENYVMNNASLETLTQISRNKSYSNLTIVSPLPILIVGLSLLYRLHLTWAFWPLYFTFIYGSIFILFLIRESILKISYNFKKGWARLIYISFAMEKDSTP
ncbi:hypothetical protein [Siphonobacter sp. SORGH_AS_1065]|uniref:hypothetical protein n=1 Tax=Siphonobacter sp. SORGH_AS_1065 TaxID=3041795 RepID=UPI002786C83F|nr:hypothetical protein [Siphonobacter sp. SORGH_AS_1065]MDQ1088585.1 putative membrane protein [Siphonobacter sp. SORGH_AS_1065]